METKSMHFGMETKSMHFLYAEISTKKYLIQMSFY